MSTKLAGMPPQGAVRRSRIVARATSERRCVGTRRVSSATDSYFARSDPFLIRSHLSLRLPGWRNSYLVARGTGYAYGARWASWVNQSAGKGSVLIRSIRSVYPADEPRRLIPVQIT